MYNFVLLIVLFYFVLNCFSLPLSYILFFLGLYVVYNLSGNVFYFYKKLCESPKSYNPCMLRFLTDTMLWHVLCLHYIKWKIFYPFIFIHSCQLLSMVFLTDENIGVDENLSFIFYCSELCSTFL